MPERAVSIRIAVRDLEQARARLLSLGAEGQAALARIEGAAPAASKGLQDVDKSAVRLRGGLAQAGTQFGSFVNQVASGTNVLRAFAQTASTALFAFGPKGVVIGTITATIAGLAEAFMDAGDEADRAADAAQRLSDVQEALARLTDDSTRAIRDQVAEVSQLEGAARAAGIALLEARRELGETARAREIDALRQTLGELESVLLQPSESEVLGRGPIIQALGAIQEAQARDDPAALAVSISRLVREMDDPALVTFQERLAKSAATIIDAAADTQALTRALEEAGDGAIQTSRQLDEAARAAERAAAEAQREAERQERFERQKAERLARDIERISRETIRRGERARAQAAAQAEREAEELRRQLEREAEEQQRLMAQPFENALRSIQGTVADTFEEIFRGGVTSFEDLAEAARDIFARLAAELATLMVFRPELVSSAAGATGAAPSLAQALSGAPAAAPTGGPGRSPSIVGHPGTPGHAALAGQSTFLGMNAFGAGLTGASVGTTAGSAIGGNPTGAALGSVAGAVIGGLVGGPLGAFIGGTLGGLAGGFIGGGGGGKNARTTVASGTLLGGLSGTNEGSQLVQRIDQQLMDILTARQEAIANQALRTAPTVSVQYNRGEISANDMMSLARGRVAPIAQALGLNAGRIAQGTPEQQLRNLQTAIGIMREIEGFRLGPIKTQLRDLDDQFRELNDEARRLGVSTAGLTEEHKRRREELTRQIKLEQTAVAERVGAMTPLQAALRTLELQMQQAAAEAKQLGISTANVAKEQARLAEEIKRQHRAQVDALALSIIEPFERLKDPLRQLQTQLEFSLLSPAGQMAAAAADFRRIAREAAGGSTIAIDQLAGAGQLFIEQAGRFGASPAQVSAVQEVQSVIRDVLGRIENAQRAAERGVEDVIRRASREQIDRLQELIDVGRETVDELKRLRR